MASKKLLNLSAKQAQFLLKGVDFFISHPQEKEWRHLDKSAFFLLVQNLAQFDREKEENLDDYFLRLESFLIKIATDQITAASLPPNLKELVTAFEEFQNQGSAELPPPEKISYPTIEDWIKKIENDARRENIKKAVTEIVSSQTELSSEEKTALSKKLSRPIKKIAPLPIGSKVDTQKTGQKSLEETIKRKVAIVIKKTTAVPKNDIPAVSQRISQAISHYAPQLSPTEKDNLLPTERKAITIRAINAALPEISQILISKGRQLSSIEAKSFFSQLEKEISEPLVDHTVERYHQRTKTASPAHQSTVQRITAALEKDPSLPSRFVPDKMKVSVGQSMKEVVLTHGINPASNQVVQTLSKSVAAMAVSQIDLSPKNKKTAIEELSQSIEKIDPFSAKPEIDIQKAVQAVLNKHPQLQIIKEEASLINAHPPIDRQQLDEKIAVVLKQTTTVSKKNTPAVSQRISQAISRYTPRLSPMEESNLSSIERGAITIHTINAALPEISQILTNENISLSNTETGVFLKRLEEETNTSLIDCSVKRYHRAARIINPAGQSTVQQVIATLKKDPSLPYHLVPTEAEASIGQSIRDIVLTRGINTASNQTIQTLNEPVRAFSNLILNRSATTGREVYQRIFIEKHPVLAEKFRNFYQTGQKSWQRYQRPFYRRMTTNRFQLGLQRGFQSIRNLWQATPIGQQLTQNIKSKAFSFLKNGLSSLKIFGEKGLSKLGQNALGKLAKTGLGKGIKKAVSFLSEKLAASKLGAVLGGLPGAAIGLVVDLGKTILGGFSRLLGRFSGGETEGEKTVKTALGPIGKIVLDPFFLAIVGTPILIIILNLHIMQTEGNALVMERGGPGRKVSPQVSMEPEINYDVSEKLAKIFRDCACQSNINCYINQNNKIKILACAAKHPLASQIDNFPRALTEISYSIMENKSLQCVGFVIAVEKARGKNLPQCGHAKDFTDCRAIEKSSQYQYVNDCLHVSAGTIAVNSSGEWGHIGIVSHISQVGQPQVRFVSAWGTNGNQGGVITIQPYILSIDEFCQKFDTFIKSK